MKSYVLTEKGKIVQQEREKPAIGPGEVLLHVMACGICSSDIPRVFKGQVYHFPLVLGHEFSGQIEAVGEGVDPAYVGRRAVVFPLLPCKKCAACSVGEYARCDHYDYFGSRRDGAMTEYLAVPIWNIIPFSDSIDYTKAAMCEPAAVSLHAVNAATLRVGHSVVVVGPGSIGLLIAMWARVLGIEKVFVVGTSDEKLDFVRGLGFAHTVNASKEDPLAYVKSQTDGAGADVTFECVGSSESLQTCLLTTKKSGQVIVVGNPVSDITLPQDVYWKILRNELTVRGAWNSKYNEFENDWKTVLEHMATGRLDVSPLVTHTFPMWEVDKALEAISDRSEMTIKVVLTNEA